MTEEVANEGMATASDGHLLAEHYEAGKQHAIREIISDAGVTVLDPAHTVVEPSVTVGPDTVLHPGVTLLGAMVAYVAIPFQVYDLTGSNPPTWFVEGMAEYFSWGFDDSSALVSAFGAGFAPPFRSSSIPEMSSPFSPMMARAGSPGVSSSR